MKIINRYLLSSLAQTTIVVLLIFCSLYAIFEIVLETSKYVGKGDYTSFSMFQFVMLRIPTYMYQILPIAVLIGCLIALTRLSTSSEYAVIRTSGISAGRIIGLMCIFALCFSAITFVVGEWVAPNSQKQAEILKYNALNQQAKITSKQGLWVKNLDEITEIGEMLPDKTLINIKRYLIENNQLNAMYYAQQAKYQDTGTWLLTTVSSTGFLGDKTIVTKSEQANWQLNIEPQVLDVLVVDPEKMSATDLKKYVHHLNNNHQQTVSYEVAYWNKIFYPFASLAMVLLAIAFTPVLYRHSNMGLRIVLGLCLGIGFHFAARLFSFYSELFHLSPIIAAGSPIILFTVIAWLIARKGMA